MEEKIKIYIPNDVYQTLLKDMELFEFYKNDHSLNKNEFLNKLIVNYHSSYAESNSKIYEHIKNNLKVLGMSDTIASSNASSITEFTTKQALDLDNKKLDVVISMKPTKFSSRTFDYVESFLLNGSSMSGWLRNLLASYVRLPQDKREKIIFKENFDAINEALEKNKMLYFVVKNKNGKKHRVSPFALSSSKEELFNYLIAQEHGKPFSFRVSRISNITVLNEQCNVSKNCSTVFEKMVKYGPQFTYSLDENEPIKIKLTERGKLMYERIYIHRPPYSEIDDNIYTFDCSTNQVTQYFQRFGRNAIILSPENIRNEMFNYYKDACNAYCEQ
ncbi:MAG: WYL domain-containing protein [Erysipelotrichaceae bacterium]|nr:WYL domain-containing protein [Erysipelotrichaceae bacterium]